MALEMKYMILAVNILVRSGSFKLVAKDSNVII